MVGVRVSGLPMSRRKWKLVLTAVPVRLLPASTPVPYRSSSAVMGNAANAQIEMEVLDTSSDVVLEVLDILPPTFPTTNLSFHSPSVGITLVLLLFR